MHLQKMVEHHPPSLTLGVPVRSPLSKAAAAALAACHTRLLLKLSRATFEVHPGQLHMLRYPYRGLPRLTHAHTTHFLANTNFAIHQPIALTDVAEDRSLAKKESSWPSSFKRSTQKPTRAAVHVLQHLSKRLM